MGITLLPLCMKATLQNPEKFLADFLQLSQRAKRSIYIQTMNFENGEVLKQIGSVLEQKASEGVRVRIHADWVAQRFVHGQLRLLPNVIVNNKERSYAEFIHRKNDEMRSHLQKKGVSIIETNSPILIPKIVPPLRRNHIKLYIIDEEIAWMGGINLLDNGFKNIDFMVKFADKKYVSAFSRQFFMINSKRPADDYRQKIGEDSTLFVDSGKYAQSIIYKAAIKAVRSASNSVTLMSQFVPDIFLLTSIIRAAQRGVHIKIYTSSKADRKFNRYPDKLVYDYFLGKIRKFSNISFTHLEKKVHAKLLLIDEKVALFGSHNYSYFGVLFGTEEIMLQTTNHHLVEQIISFVKQNT